MCCVSHFAELCPCFAFGEGVPVVLAGDSVFADCSGSWHVCFGDCELCQRFFCFCVFEVVEECPPCVVNGFGLGCGYGLVPAGVAAVCELF